MTTRHQIAANTRDLNAALSFADRLLTVVDPADDGVFVAADVLSVEWPRPIVSGGAVVVEVPGLSSG